MSIDWTRGVWHSSGKEAILRVTVAGDWGVCQGYEETLLDRPEGIYGDLLPLLRQSDVNIVNVESVFGNQGQPIPKEGPNLWGDRLTVRSLAKAPFHLACLANNHSMDFGVQGLASTISLLHKSGIKSVGAGLTGPQAALPLIVTVKGVRIGIINCAEGEECRSRDGGPGAYGLVVPLLERQVAALKRRVDAVIVIFHGGREYAPLPPPYVVKALRRIAEAGADAVAAHHPHVPQGIEVHGEVPIAYSLGNFVFWQESSRYYQRVGYLFHLDFAETCLAGFEISPYRLEPEALSLLKGEAKALFLRDLQEVSEPLSHPEEVSAAWDAFIDYHGGIEAHLRELASHIEAMSDDPVLYAAKILNKLETPAHQELIERGLRRIVDRTPAESPTWASKLVSRWDTLSYPNR